MLSTMQRRAHGPIGDDRSAVALDRHDQQQQQPNHQQQQQRHSPHGTGGRLPTTSPGGAAAAASSASKAPGGGGESVSFWSSLSVVDSLFSDDPPFRLGQTMSADHATTFGGGGTDPHLLHPQHMPLGGAGGLYRSSFDEGGFYGSSSLFSTSSSPILSPPASPALHGGPFSSEEDLPPHHLQQPFNGGRHHVPVGGGGGGGFHANGLHSTNGVTTARKQNYYALYANGGGQQAANGAVGVVGGGKYSSPRPSNSGLPNGAGHKHPNGGLYGGGGFGGGHHHQPGGGGAVFRGSPPRSQPIHAPQRGSNMPGGHSLGGSGGYPASPPSRMRNGGVGSMPRSSPPRHHHQQPPVQQQSYLSTALKGAGAASHLHGNRQQQQQQQAQYGSGGQIGLYAAAADGGHGDNICFEEEAAVGPAGGGMIGSGLLSSSPGLLHHGSGSQPIQIARAQQQSAGSVLGGGSMGPRSPSLLAQASPVPSPSTVAAALSLSGQLNLGSLRLVDDSLAVEASPLLQLPSTTLLRIFGFLSASDLARLEQVCKRRLSYLANDDGLWKELYLRRYKLLESNPSALADDREASAVVAAASAASASRQGDQASNGKDDDGSDSSSDEWAWIYSLLQQNERWKDIFKTRYSAEQWRIGSLKMFNGCWGFISQTPAPGQSPEQTLDIFFHRKDIAPDGEWYDDWWLKDTPGVSRSQKCGYWDTFLCGRIVRYKQRAAYAQGRRPQACNISFVGEERRDPITGEPLPALHDAKVAQRSLAAARFG